MGKFIIGMTGAFGSGCSFIIEKFIATLGYYPFSLSDKLRNLYFDETGEKNPDRRALQDYGNKIRSEKSSDYLAKLVIKEIEINTNENFIVDSIRNPAEIDAFRKVYPDFYLVGIFAEYNVRWERIKGKYHNNSAEFEIDEKRDKGFGENESGQRVADCFFESDLIISNNDPINRENEAFRVMQAKITKYINLFKKPGSELPNDIESAMAMAYSSGLRSCCLKRKVGAVVTDQFGNIFSSGYNEVPIGEDTCKEKYGECYRNYEKKNIRDNLGKYIKDPKDIESAANIYKILDLCRSLHAEENAIINIARFGSASVLLGATLYTTTYPCNLCANKIAQVGIKRIVYFEPYPVLQAKEIFDKQRVEQIPFEGITFRSFFKVFKPCN